MGEDEMQSNEATGSQDEDRSRHRPESQQTACGEEASLIRSLVTKGKVTNKRFSALNSNSAIRIPNTGRIQRSIKGNAVFLFLELIATQATGNSTSSLRDQRSLVLHAKYLQYEILF